MLLLGCWLVGLPGCGLRAPATRSERLSRVEELVFEGMEYPAGKTEEALVKELGAPQQVRTMTIKDPLVPDQEDLVREITYDGLVVVFHVADVRRPDAWMVSRIVTAPRWKVKWGVGVGVERWEVERLLGQPQTVSGEVWEYRRSYGAEERHAVRFHFTESRVVKVEWFFDVE